MKRYLFALPWIGRIFQATLGSALALTVIVYGYLYFNDPLDLDSVRGSMIGPGDLKLYLTGFKRHENCPGRWHVTLNTRRNGRAWLVSEIQPTGVVPAGAMNEVSVQTHFSESPPPGSYTATLNVQYDCLLQFQDQASFELIVP